MNILKSSDQACLDFMQEIVDNDEGETVMEILFECPDKLARNHLIRIIRYLVCRLKEIEKDKIMANEFDTITETYVNIYGETGTRQIKEPRSLSLKFLGLLKGEMHSRAAKSWKQIETYMDLLFSFGVQSAQDVEDESTGKVGSKSRNYDRESLGYQIGMTEFARTDFITTIGDFVLQDNSPLYKISEYRVTMGNYYTQPDFDKAFMLITIMMSDKKLQETYPMSEDANKICNSKEFLA